ncbi:MAG: hypothetical protein JWN71_1903 [Xanthobacteraceae bacterium]|nr:hypothetical protein [Xanthobacteraceae bacterium]
MGVVYVQTSSSLQTNSGAFTPIPGLSLTLPEGDDMSALVILNLPNPYAEGSNYPGGALGISVNGSISPVIASFTYGVEQPASFNRMPTTLVVNVPLDIGEQTVEALWMGVRGSTVIIDSPASLSATY